MNKEYCTPQYFERWRKIVLETMGWKRCWIMPGDYITSGDRNGQTETITIGGYSPQRIVKQMQDWLNKRNEYSVGGK